MRFTYEFMTLTQLGRLFDASSHEVGRWLVKIGLRTEANKPSHLAFDNGYVKIGPSRGTGYNYVWNSEKTVAALEEAGHRFTTRPNTELLQPSKLNGPFEVRKNRDLGYEVANSDNTVAVWVRGEENAQFICRLLNLADQKGVVDKLLGKADAPNAIPMTEAATA